MEVKAAAVVAVAAPVAVNPKVVALLANRKIVFNPPPP